MYIPIMLSEWRFGDAQQVPPLVSEDSVWLLHEVWSQHQWSLCSRLPILCEVSSSYYSTVLWVLHTWHTAHGCLWMLPPRSSYTASQSYTWAHWTGDPSSDWYDIHTQHTSTLWVVMSSTECLIALFCRSFASGLPAQITASLNIGLSGMPFSGSDIGER